MNSSKSASKPKVVIVGGGTAGLAASYTLRKYEHELDVTVLEAADRAGGRIFGEEIDGFHIDSGATIFLESYHTARRLAESLGIPLKECPHAKSALVYSKGKFHPIYTGGSLKQMLVTARTIFSFGLLSPKASWQFLRFFRMLKARSKDFDLEDYSGMLDLDTEENFTAFMAANSMSEYLEQSGQVDISSYTCGHPEQVGAGYAMLLIWGFSLNASMPILPEKGVGSFATALTQACVDKIRLSTPVERVVLQEGSVKGVMTRGGEFMEADAVICATPATIASKIIPDLPADVSNVLRRVTYSCCCVVDMGLDSELFPKDYFAAAFPRRSGALMGIVVNMGFIAPKAAPEGKTLLHVAVFAERARELFTLSDDEISDRVIRDMRKYFPAMPQKPRFTRVFRWPEAVCLAPGGMLKGIYQMRQQGLGVNGLFLAGDYMRLPVSNGAMQSGVDAAEDCVSFLSQRIT